MQGNPSSIERQLTESLSPEQLRLLSIWLAAELVHRLDEGYTHSDLILSLCHMAQKMLSTSRNKSAEATDG